MAAIPEPTDGGPGLGDSNDLRLHGSRLTLSYAYERQTNKLASTSLGLMASHGFSQGSYPNGNVVTGIENQRQARRTGSCQDRGQSLRRPPPPRQPHVGVMPPRWPFPAAAAGRKGCWAADGARRHRVSETPTPRACCPKCPSQRCSRADRAMSYVLTWLRRGRLADALPPDSGRRMASGKA